MLWSCGSSSLDWSCPTAVRTSLGGFTRRHVPLSGKGSRPVAFNHAVDDVVRLSARLWDQVGSPWIISATRCGARLTPSPPRKAISVPHYGMGRYVALRVCTTQTSGQSVYLPHRAFSRSRNRFTRVARNVPRCTPSGVGGVFPTTGLVPRAVHPQLQLQFHGQETLDTGTRSIVHVTRSRTLDQSKQSRRRSRVWAAATIYRTYRYTTNRNVTHGSIV